MENRFFTILFLPSNPSKVKKVILSGFVIKALAVSALILMVTSSIVFLDYVSVKKKEIDLTSLKEQTKVQNVQIRTFADKISDMETELARLRSLDTKIKVLTDTVDIKTKDEKMSLGEKGGPEAMQMSFNTDPSLKEMMARLDRLNIEARVQENKLHELHTSLELEKSFVSATPSLWPVRGYLSSRFGDRESPFGDNGGKEFHEGIDISAPSGSPVVATAEGVVTFADRDTGLGNAVVLDHGYGFVSRYGHLSKILVQAGDKVKAGQSIGLVGSTGRSTGPHLHYEVAVNGFKVNPMKYLN